MLQLFFEDVAIAIFGCCNIPPIDIDECCKKHGANVVVGIVSWIQLQRLFYAHFECFRMLQMLFFTLWWADVVSDGSDIEVPVFRLKHSISRTVEWWATHTSFRSVVSSDQRLASSD